MGQFVSKFKEANFFSESCPSREVLGHVTSQWGSLILILLLEKTYRFSELKKYIGGISEKMLSQNLRALEKDGFVIRKDYREIPPRVDYSLSTSGKEVAHHVRELADYIKKHFPEVMKQYKKRSKR